MKGPGSCGGTELVDLRLALEVSLWVENEERMRALNWLDRYCIKKLLEKNKKII